MASGDSVVGQVKDIQVVHLRGGHDVGSVIDVERALFGAVRTGQPVVVDLSDCSFVDSSTVAALLQPGV
jgi:anti-anti-sigma regulatory factor